MSPSRQPAVQEVPATPATAAQDIMPLTLGAGPALQARQLAGADMARLVHVPIGWRQPEGGRFEADVELFVLEGRLDVGGQSFSRYSYVYLPAGTPTAHWESSHGAMLLLWAAPSPLFTTATDAAWFKQEAALLHSNYFAEIFDTAALPGVDLDIEIPDFRAKLLRDDPAAGVAVWITHGVGKRTLVPAWQSYAAALEMFVLEVNGLPALRICGERSTALGAGIHVGIKADQVHTDTWPDNGGYLLRLYRLQSGIDAPQQSLCP